MTHFIRCLVAVFAISQFRAEANPRARLDGSQQENRSAFIWWPSANGTVVKAYLEGGPRLDPRAMEDTIKFYNFNSYTPDDRHELIIGDERTLDNYMRGAQLKIICHGFTSDSDSGPATLLRQAYFSQGYIGNIIAIDWRDIAAAPWYDAAAAGTKTVGYKTGHLLYWLLYKGAVTLAQIHFIGHSLGAHVGGCMGESMGSDKIARITALDPALPLFESCSDKDRIDPSDAVFVDVIHTAGGYGWQGSLAFMDPRGHVDFYPNEGCDQPGCGWDLAHTCSHGRAIEYLVESIGYPRKFKACKCSSWDEYENGQCYYEDDVANMGEHVDPSARGSYYLYTNDAPPYSQ